jgi:hypothetical protein
MMTTPPTPGTTHLQCSRWHSRCPGPVSAPWGSCRLSAASIKRARPNATDRRQWIRCDMKHLAVVQLGNRRKSWTFTAMRRLGDADTARHPRCALLQPSNSSSRQNACDDFRGWSTSRRYASRIAATNARAISVGSVDRRVYEVRDPVEAHRVPRIGRHEIGDVGKRHAARRIGPGV